MVLNRTLLQTILCMAYSAAWRGRVRHGILGPLLLAVALLALGVVPAAAMPLAEMTHCDAATWRE